MRKLLAVALSLVLADGPLFAHQVGRADKLRWDAPCAIAYPDKDPFEKEFTAVHCDYLQANQAGQADRFNKDMSLTQQRSFLFMVIDKAEAAKKALADGEKTLLAETDPLQPDDRSPEGRSRKLVEDKAKVQDGADELTEPFGGKKEYRKKLDARVVLLDKELEKSKKLLSEKEKKLVESMEAKLQSAEGSTGGLKRMEALKGGDASAAAGKFENARAGGKAAGEPPQGGPAKVGAGQGDQLAKGAAGADKVQGRFGKDNFDKILNKDRAERIGDASENRSLYQQGVELKANVFPSEKSATAKPFSEGKIVAGKGVSEEAKAEAARVMDKMLANAPQSVRDNLEANKVKLVIVPKGGNLADYAPELKNERTIDGRCFTYCTDPKSGKVEYGSVKAVADIPLHDSEGSVACLVPEDNLIGNRTKDSRGFPKDYTTVHEFGHMVELYGLPKSRTPGQVYDDYVGNPDPKRVPTLDAYRQSFKENVGRSGMDTYGKADDREYFAQFSAAWFGKHDEGLTAQQLKRTDPKMYQQMENIYGPPAVIG